MTIDKLQDFWQNDFLSFQPQIRRSMDWITRTKIPFCQIINPIKKAKKNMRKSSERIWEKSSKEMPLQEEVKLEQSIRLSNLLLSLQNRPKGKYKHCKIIGVLKRQKVYYFISLNNFSFQGHILDLPMPERNHSKQLQKLTCLETWPMLLPNTYRKIWTSKDLETYPKKNREWYLVLSKQHWLKIRF